MSVNYGIPLKSQFADEEFQLTLRFLIFAAKIRYVLIRLYKNYALFRKSVVLFDTSCVFI